MNRRKKLHAAREHVDAMARALANVLPMLSPETLRDALRTVFRAGYDAAESDVCARCGAEIAAADEEMRK